jgi:phenylpropionate dioxygenase-like ring-hydroxylating dioxygenase large terminal subunit
MFTLRLLEGGKTEGQTVLITKKRPGFLGWLLNRLILFVTQLVGNYFTKGDTQVFQTIKFNLKTPTKADQSIVQFMQHVEQQQPLAWGTWEPALELAQVPVTEQPQTNSGVEPEPERVWEAV